MPKVKRIEITNIKAISSQVADFNGLTAIITGGNNKGKTSFLRSLPDRLRGIKPDVIIKTGEKEGEATWELTTGEKFIWRLSKNAEGEVKEKLTYISERDIKSAVSKELMNRYFPATFDVDKFLQDGPAKQRAALQKLAGIDFTAIDARYKSAYEERTWANRKAADEQAKVTTVDMSLPEETTPKDDLLAQINAIDAHNQKVKTVQDGIALRKATVDGNNQTIELLQAQIKELEEKNAVLQKAVTDGNEWLDKPHNASKTDADRAALNEKLTALEQQNAKIENNNKARLQAKTYAEAQEAATKADELVKSIEKEKDDLIRSANLPEGFGFSDEGITYKGLPFTKEQLSSSGIYIAALKLAAMTLGEVKTLHFDASFLDKASLLEIEQWANGQDLQLLIERPAYEGGEIHYELIQGNETQKV